MLHTRECQILHYQGDVHDTATDMKPAHSDIKHITIAKALTLIDRQVIVEASVILLCESSFRYL